MPPSYSVRRGRLTAQLTCRTGTSYTPVKHTPLNIFILTIRYSLLVIHQFIVRSHTQLSCGRTRQRLAVGVAPTRATLANNKRWRITQNHHASHHASPAHLRVLCALCVPSLRTFSHHARITLAIAQYTLILRNHLGAQPGRRLAAPR